MSIELRIMRLPHGADLPLPAYATDGAAGMDLLAAVAEPVVIATGQRVLIPTGLAIALPPRVRVAGQASVGTGVTQWDRSAEQPRNDR